MKRTLSLVLALVMLLGTIPVFAADTADEKIAFLVEEGLLKGNTAGDLMLDVELKREDSVVVLARLLGLEEAAVAWETAPTWTDLPENPYYTSVLGWAQEAGYYEGKPGNVFGFGESITANDFALVLLRALGYAEVGDDSWETAFETAEELGLLEGVEAEKADKLLRSNMALMMFAALGTEMAEGGKTLAEELGVEMPTVEISVEATGRKKLTVTFNKAVTGATFAVNKGNVVVNYDSAVMATDGKSAVITTTVNLTAGTYTVKVSGVAEEVLEATVTVTNERVADIVLLADKAPIDATTNTSAHVSYELRNQYGEKMTSNPGNLQWTASTSNGVDFSTFGSLILKSNNPFIPGTKVFINAVFTDTTAGYSVVKNFEAEIVLPARADKVVFGGVAKVGGTEFVALPSGYATGEYVLAFTVLDQYGNKLTLGNDLGGLTFVSNNPLFVDSNFTKGSNVTIGNVVYHTVNIVAPTTGTANGGTVTVQAISQWTGSISTYTLSADALSRVTSFTMQAPDGIIAGNDTKIYIPFVALDQFGNNVTKASLLSAVDLGNPTGTTLNWELQNDGTTKLYFVPAANTGTTDTMVYLTSLIPTNGNFSSLMLNVKPNAVPTSIVGLASTKATSLAIGTEVSITGGNLLIQDQYGRNMSKTKIDTWMDAAATNKIVVEYTTSGAFTFTPATAGTELVSSTDTVKLMANSNTGASTKSVVFTISGKPASARTIVFTRVAQSAFTSYEIADLGLMHANSSDDYHKELKVYGITSTGTKVQLAKTAYTVAAHPNLNFDAATSKLAFANIGSLDFGTAPNYKNATTSILVTILDENVTGAAKDILSKDVVLSAEPSRAVSIELSDDVVNGKAFVNPVGTTTSGEISHTELYGFVEKVLDQYGVKLNVSTAGSITITNVVKASATGGFTVSNNGLVNASIAGAAYGDKFNVTFKYGTVSTVVEFTVGLPQ